MREKKKELYLRYAYIYVYICMHVFNFSFIFFFTHTHTQTNTFSLHFLSCLYHHFYTCFDALFIDLKSERCLLCLFVFVIVLSPFLCFKGVRFDMRLSFFSLACCS